MSATNELRERIAKALATGILGGWSKDDWDSGSGSSGWRGIYMNAADDAIAVLPKPGPRMVSADEAKVLPRGSVIKSHYGAVLERLGGSEWLETGTEWAVLLTDYQLPAQLLWTPKHNLEGGR